MNHFHKLVSVTFALATVLFNQPSQAAVYSEVGEAGDTFDTAQLVLGTAGESLDAIAGNLLSSQDNDFFRFFYDGTGNLSIRTGPYTNTPFPTNTFPGFELFSDNGVSLGGAGESLNPSPFGNKDFVAGNSSIVYQSGVSLVNYQNLPIGEYVLRVDGSGQFNSGKPRYVGNYSVSLQGAAQFIEQVPEPTSILSLLAVSAIASATVIKTNRKQFLG
ncbi:MAG: hypothetical protein DSM106950_00930 [Stigonema ocellatum SAG 48.90 = DSM 106950]|nr:hypothetical protein [Stigonema ocellatum SAG 48.90 = DSM 106950]